MADLHVAVLSGNLAHSALVLNISRSAVSYVYGSRAWENGNQWKVDAL